MGRFASDLESEDLPFTCKKHQSLLRRRLGNSDPQLQENKVENLKIACPTIDGILIKPGQTFSFWRQLGEATAEKGYCEGMQLSRGEVVRGVGGGLCQLANLLYWMALHTPLEIVERHHHSFDLFRTNIAFCHSAVGRVSFTTTSICGFSTDRFDVSDQVVADR
jgi:vancomycin resistance protein VanW